jgi:hypothetical protein
MLRGVWAKLKVSSVMLIWKCLGEETPNLRFVAQIEQREITGAGSLDARLAACRCFQLYQPNVRYPSLPPIDGTPTLAHQAGNSSAARA